MFSLISHVIPVCRLRSQYPTESHSNGSAASAAERVPQRRGLPSDPRPPRTIASALRPESGSSIDALSPSSPAGHTRNADSLQYRMPVPDTSAPSPGSYPEPWNSPSAGRNYTNGFQSPGSTLQKKTSVRPPGAAEPRIPGHASDVDSRDDPSNITPSLGFNSPMSSASSSYFPRDAVYVPGFSNIPPPPPLKPPTHAQTPARPKDALERDSSEDILAHGTHGFARPLSHSKFLTVFSGIFRTEKTIVLCLQCPAASSRCDPPAPSRLPRVRARADWSVIGQRQLSRPRPPCQQHTVVTAGIRTPLPNTATRIPVSWPSSRWGPHHSTSASSQSLLDLKPPRVRVWHPRSSG